MKNPEKHSTRMYQETSLLHHVNDYQKSTPYKMSMYDKRLFSQAVNEKRK